MKVLVVGAGMYVTGRGTPGFGTVIPALAQASRQLRIEEVLVCSTSDRGRESVSRAATEVNRRLGTSLRVHHAVLDEVLHSSGAQPGFDCAIVSVPDDLHLSLGLRVLEAGMHCLMVKPLVPTVKDAKQLISMADERRLYGAVEFHKRFDEGNLVVRRLIQEGRLGRPSYATVEYSQRITIPRDTFTSWASRTNIFQYLGVHYVDLMYFMTGFRPRRAMAVGHRGVLTGAGIETYDSVHAIVGWEPPDRPGEEFITQFAIGWIDPEQTSAMSEQRYVLVGSQSRVECDQKNRGLRLVGPSRGVEDINPYFSEYLAPEGVSLEFSGYGYRSIERFLLDVRDLKEGETEPSRLEGKRPTFRSALPSTAVVQSVGESLDAGSPWRNVDDAI